MEMGDVVAWVRRFLAWDGAVQVGGDGDALERRAELCADEVAAGLRTMPEPLHPAAERALFKVKRYDHPEMGELYGAVVSEATTASGGQGKYELQLFARAIEGRLRVVGVWFVCTACVALGVDFAGDTCIECEGLGWERWFGEAWETPGAVTALEAVEWPGSSLYLPEYRRDLGEAVPT